MNLSAILVVSKPEQIRRVCSDLALLDGIEVHHVDENSGRAIVSQEAPSVDEEVRGLERLQNHPSIVLAEMIEHHFDNDSPSPEQPS